MRRKTISLVVGALALIASMAFAQAAFASHETVQKTTQFVGSIVPAYKQCVTGTSTNFHAAPVSFPSCVKGTNNSTGDVSPLLMPQAYNTPTTGGGFSSQFVINTKAPSPAPPVGFGTSDVVDVKVSATATGVLCETTAVDVTGQNGWVTAAMASARCPSGAGGGYDGPTIGESTIRTTDAENCASPCDTGTIHATVEDFDFSFVIGCTSGTCSINSTADAQFGPVYDPIKDPTVNNMRSDIEILSVRTQDPGGNANAGTGCPLSCGDGDEHDAARQGLFLK